MAYLLNYARQIKTMKHLGLLFISLSIALTGITQNCTTAVSSAVFQQKYALVAAQSTDQNKLNTAIAFSSINCMSSNQVMLIASLFSDDNYRVEFCKLSYASTVDKENFYEVYNAFTLFSTVFRLHDFVTDISNTPASPTPPAPPTNTPKPISFPNYNYPDYTNYAGSAGCPTPMSETDFKVLATTINTLASDQDKMTEANVLLAQNCMSMAQAMKLASLFGMESNALKFLKTNFQHVYDQNNHGAANQCFGHSPYQNDWNLFCSHYLTPHPPPEPVITCNVEEAEFKGLLKNIDNANFAKDQIAVAKSLNKHHCFTTDQVKRIMNELSFPADKLTVAELFYSKCLNPEKYYTLRNEFTFPSYQEQFDQLIK